MSDISQPKPPRFERDRRRNPANFFEPIFDPNDVNTYHAVEWKFPSKSISHKTLEDTDLKTLSEAEFKIVFTEIKFEYCDFLGDMSVATPTFKRCDFTKCDFAFSQWRRAKFKNCRFSRCSLTVVTFDYCDFTDCNFSEISLSGNETLLSGTTVNNPGAFISAAYTTTDLNVLQEHARGDGRSVDYQRMRLEGTKATIARIIKNNLALSGSEDSYYQAVCVSHNTSADAKIMKTKFELSKKPGLERELFLVFRLLTLFLEKTILNSAGKINNWGQSVAKPTLIGAGVIFIFSLIYWMTGIRPTFFRALVTSADITLLVGYTKHAAKYDLARYQLLFCANMIVGLVWYSVFVPTIINRISRVR